MGKSNEKSGVPEWEIHFKNNVRGNFIIGFLFLSEVSYDESDGIFHTVHVSTFHSVGSVYARTDESTLYVVACVKSSTYVGAVVGVNVGSIGDAVFLSKTDES